MTAQVEHLNSEEDVKGLWELPDSWGWRNLDFISNIDIGGTPDRRNHQYWGEGNIWVSIADLNGGIVTDSKEKITDLGVKNSNVKEVKTGTILMSFKLTIGKLGIAGTNLYTNEAIAALPIKANVCVDKKYLFHSLKVVRLNVDADLAVKGFTLNKKKLARIQIPIPFPDQPERSYQIQRAIVARLESHLNEIKQMRQELEQMEASLNGVLATALDDIFGQTREGFKVINIDKSQIKPISAVASLERGKFSYRPRNEPKFFGGSIPWVQIQDLPKDESKYITTHMNTLNEEGLAISKLFAKGTIVISIAATIGALGILSFDACFPDSLVGIVPKSRQEIDYGFLFWQLLYMKRYLDAIAPAAAQKNINLQILSQIEIWKPSLNDQKAINSYLDGVQADIEEMRIGIQADRLRLAQAEQGILEQAFRGEL